MSFYFIYVFSFFFSLAFSLSLSSLLAAVLARGDGSFNLQKPIIDRQRSFASTRQQQVQEVVEWIGNQSAGKIHSFSRWNNKTVTYTPTTLSSTIGHRRRETTKRLEHWSDCQKQKTVRQNRRNYHHRDGTQHRKCLFGRARLSLNLNIYYFSVIHSRGLFGDWHWSRQKKEKSRARWMLLKYACLASLDVVVKQIFSPISFPPALSANACLC